MSARRRLRATLGYRGTHYAGWAAQPHKPTVQAGVESALAVAVGHPVQVTAAGRTDAGVHAVGQVISFDTTSSITAPGLHRVLANVLPDDIWVESVAEADADFDARRSAKRRWYRYAVWRSACPSPAWHARSLVEVQPLDLPAMRAAARSLLGRRDFASFLTRPATPVSTERKIVVADWLQLTEDLLVFEIAADAFLKQMVRAIVGSLLWVGTGRWRPAQFVESLNQADRRAAGPNAPAHGLTLHRIDY